MMPTITLFYFHYYPNPSDVHLLHYRNDIGVTEALNCQWYPDTRRIRVHVSGMTHNNRMLY